MAGIEFAAAGPHFHEAIDLPPAVVPTSAVPLASKGDKLIVFAVADVAPPSAAELPATVMIPFASTEPEATYFVTVKLQAFGRVEEMSTVGDVCTASVTDVRQDDAAKITSDTFARTV